MHVKICCIQSISEARIAVEAGAAWLGLVGAMPSGPGPITNQRIAEITAWTAGDVSSVLLSSETTIQGLVAHAGRCCPDILQIVDTPARGAYAALRAAHPAMKLMQVIHVEGPSAIDQALAIEANVDFVLLDSGRPSAKVKELGGTGRAHDWSVSAEIVHRLQKPVVLAGGLSAENVVAAIRHVRPYGIDLCTGVRTEGRLDTAKLSAFMAAVESAG